MKKGFVSFVGSGPGDPELLTVKAIDRISKADAILYDDLASGPILEQASKNADLVGVGKRAGRVSPKQVNVSCFLVDYALAGQNVVRLKSGDGGIFGRLEEEILALTEADIHYEIIPGVSSACAAAAAAGIPLTRRLTARRVQFLTAHDSSGELPKDISVSALADPKVTTAVFMGKRTFPQLARLIIESGLPAETPAILAEGVSTKDQRIHYTTVSALEKKLSDYKSAAPALILYGPLLDVINS
ncbi:MAG: uroporphyrinogen-III C-methyltransferase [Pseudomonadota bacterium]|nr:uroporphyrinogen-III C-methyltransferase [Pseudomonadota bacterium]